MLGGISGKGKGEGKRLKWWYIVDWLHIPMWKGTKKSLAVALSGVARRMRGRQWGHCKKGAI
jgi:hypothetical protein